MQDRIDKLQSKFRQQWHLDDKKTIQVRDIHLVSMEAETETTSVSRGEFDQRHFLSDEAKNLLRNRLRDKLLLGNKRFTAEGEALERIVLAYTHHSELSNKLETDIINLWVEVICKELAPIAQKYHLKDNYLPVPYTTKFSSTLKPGCENNITRLISEEFSFFTSANFGPLTLDGFQTFLLRLQEGVRELPEDVHLILGTFPVAYLDYQQSIKLTNILVVVEGGLSTQLKLYAKAIPAKYDPAYIDLRYDNFLHIKHFDFGKLPNTFISPDCLSFNIGVNFTTKTRGGLTLGTVIDICAEHESNLAIMRMQQCMLATISDNNILPRFASQMLIGFGSEFQKEGSIARCVNYVDLLACDEQAVFVDGEDIKIEKNKEYVSEYFGSIKHLNIYEPYTLKPLLSPYDRIITEYNDFSIVLKALKHERDNHLNEIDIVTKMITQHIISLASFPTEHLPDSIQRYVREALLELQNCNDREALQSILIENAELMTFLTTAENLNRDDAFELNCRFQVMRNLLSKDILEENELREKIKKSNASPALFTTKQPPDAMNDDSLLNIRNNLLLF